MMRHLVVLYMAVLTVIVIDNNPLWALPLLLVTASFLWDRRWPGILGIVLYSTVTISRIEDASFTNLVLLAAYGAGLIAPLVLMLELILSPKPYRIERISVVPATISVGLLGAFVLALFLLNRYSRIGIFIRSDITLQVFMLVALTLLITGPVILSSYGGIRARNHGEGEVLYNNNTNR